MTSSVNNNTKNTQFDYGMFGQKVQKAESTINSLETQLEGLSQKEGSLDQSIASNTSELNQENSTIQQYKNLLEMTKANENPLNKMYGGIKQFQIQGMCGMDMGMGEMVESSMTLTGQELLDISQLLTGNADGKYKPSDLAAQLKEKGYNAEGNDGALGAGNDSSALTITRKDGSKVEFKDCNGDGQLNGCDYDFSAALAQLDADMDAYQAKLDEIQNNIDKHQAVANGLQTKIDSDNTELDGVKSNKDDTETKLDTWNAFLEDLRESRDEKRANRAFNSLMDEVSTKNLSTSDVKQILSDISIACSQSLHNRYIDGDISDKDFNDYLVQNWNSFQTQIQNVAATKGIDWTIIKKTDFTGL